MDICKQQFNKVVMLLLVVATLGLNGCNSIVASAAAGAAASATASAIYGRSGDDIMRDAGVGAASGAAAGFVYSLF